MTADEFLDKLQEQALVPADVVASLRQQVANSIRIVSPETLAKLLVDKKRLTHEQAHQLISGRAMKADGDDLLLAPLDDELRLAPLGDGAQKPKGASNKATGNAAPVAKSAAPASPKANPAPAAATPAPSAKPARAA